MIHFKQGSAIVILLFLDPNNTILTIIRATLMNKITKTIVKYFEDFEVL